MDFDTKNESLKVLDFRDKILETNKDSKDPEFIRLRLEKKLRDDSARTKNYGKYLKNGRVDKIDSRRRHKLVTPIKDLQDAYYEKYKPRKDRDNEDPDHQQLQSQNKRVKQIKPTTESFYDDDSDFSENTKYVQNANVPSYSSGILPPASSGSNGSSLPGFQPSPSPTLQSLLAQSAGGSQAPINQIPPPPPLSNQPTPPPLPIMGNFGMPYNINIDPTVRNQWWFNLQQQAQIQPQQTSQQQQQQQQQQPQQQQYHQPSPFAGQPLLNPWGFQNMPFNLAQFQQPQRTPAQPINYDDQRQGQQVQYQQQHQQLQQPQPQQGQYQQNKQLQPY